MKKAAFGFVVLLFVALAMGSGFESSWGKRANLTAQPFVHHKQLVIDSEGRYVVIDLYTAEAKYVECRDSAPSRPVKAVDKEPDMSRRRYQRD